jgi:hypothetical protein
VLPDADLDDDVVSARAELLLDGPADPDHDPAGFLLGVGELVRLGQSAVAWVPDLVEVAERLALEVRRADHTGWEVPLAFREVAGVLHAAGEERGARDAMAIVDRLPPAPGGPALRDGLLVLASLDAARRLAAVTPSSAGCHRPGSASRWRSTGHRRRRLGRRSGSASAGTATARPCCGRRRPGCA